MIFRIKNLQAIGQMLKNAEISGGTLSEDGRTATLYNDKTFTDPEQAKQSVDDFNNKINKFEDDNQGRIRTSKEQPVSFRQFQRGRGKVAQNDYDWIASNLHPSQAYRDRANQTFAESGQFKKPVQEALKLLQGTSNHIVCLNS